MLLALVGILILSPDTLLVRLIDLGQWPMQAYRGLGSGLGLTCVLALMHGRATPRLYLEIGWRGVLTSLCYALSSLLFVAALYKTSVANTLAIISIAPMFGALMSRVFLKEQLPVRTWIAAGLSFLAVLVIVAGNLGGTTASVEGDLLALVQSVFMAATFTLIRSRQEINMVPSLALGGFWIVAVSLPLALMGPTGMAVPEDDIGYLLLLICGVIPVSFALLMLAPRYIPAPEVNMIMLLEMVLGPIFVFIAVGEPVPPATLLGGGLLFTTLTAHSALGLAEVRRATRAVPARD